VKWPLPSFMQQMTLRYEPITPRHHSAPEKKDPGTIAVEITNSHTGAVSRRCREARHARARSFRGRRSCKGERAERPVHPEFVPALTTSRSGCPSPFASKKLAPMSSDRLSRQRGLSRWHGSFRRAAGELKKKLSSLPLCAADVKIVEPIAVTSATASRGPRSTTGAASAARDCSRRKCLPRC